MLKTSFMLLFLLISCGKAPEMSDSISGTDASGYSDSPVLNCSLRTYKGTIIQEEIEPVDQFNWSLGSDLSLMRVLHYQVDDQKMIVVVKISEDQNQFETENSQALKIRYRRAPGRILRDGSVHDEDAYKEVTLQENVEKRIFTIPSEVKKGILMDDFRCILKSKTHPHFRSFH